MNKKAYIQPVQHSKQFTMELMQTNNSQYFGDKNDDDVIDDDDDVLSNRRDEIDWGNLW